jgi:purine-cytosine permease-like protein
MSRDRNTTARNPRTIPDRLARLSSYAFVAILLVATGFALKPSGSVVVPPASVAAGGTHVLAPSVDASLPDASAVLAQREPAHDEPAPTF